MKLKALYNAVIVKPNSGSETMHGGLIIPNINNEKNEIGTIIAVGPGHYSLTGTFIETTTQVGDVVVLPTMGFTKFEFEDETYYVGKENELLAKIN